MGVNASCQADASLITSQYFVAEKKRRLACLVTLRKRLIQRRRSSKTCDHARVIRELVSDWSLQEITALWEEYEASAALKDLTVQADLARPPAPTYKQDLSDLFDYKYCTDVDLVFQGAIFPVHRAILSVRCPYFREVLKKIPGYGAQIGVDIATPGIDIPMFSALLRYLYTGEFNVYDGTSKAQLHLSNMDLLLQLCEEFGTPNALECDLRYLLDSGEYSDCILIFSSAADVNSSEGVFSGVDPGGPSDYGFSNKLEVFCHKAVLCARSPFFRSLIQRRQRLNEEVYERSILQPMRIVLDHTVIPKRYARVLLQAVYLDTLNLSSIIRDSASTNSLSEAQSIIQTGRSHLTIVEEAMEIYQIGRFIELDILTQSCEDLIVESLSIDNLVSILRWSREAHGSSWVYRQALHFLREEFSHIAQSGVLLELDKDTLLEALTSDFLQATELEVLQAVLRWGEHQLIRRMEDREPNLVSQTAHSVSRKGLRRKDLNDVELREILSELLPHVRMDHVLPPDHDVLTQAIKRGLVSTPPSHMIGDDTTNFRINAWIRSKNNGLFVKPRLFTPYAEEIKSVVDDQASGRCMGPIHYQGYISSHIPDALYMIDNTTLLRNNFAATATVDVISAAVPVPDTETVMGMVRRERELISTAAYQRAVSLSFADRAELRKQVRLRVVREFNLPDQVADVLDGAAYIQENDSYSSDESHSLSAPCHVRDEGRSKLLLQHPEFLLDPILDASRLRDETSHLSDIVPDVALASAQLEEEDSNISVEGLHSPVTLDLGDESHSLRLHRSGVSSFTRCDRRSARNYSQAVTECFQLPRTTQYSFSSSLHHPMRPHTPPLQHYTLGTSRRHHSSLNSTTPPMFL